LGQQQLLLIVLGIIVVGIAIAISIQLFRQNAIDSKRDILMNESANIASIAIGYLLAGMCLVNFKVPSMEVTRL